MAMLTNMSALGQVSVHATSHDVDGIVKDRSISSALAMGILQSWTKPSMWTIDYTVKSWVHFYMVQLSAVITRSNIPRFLHK